jgi:formyl-CoA transferase
MQRLPRRGVPTAEVKSIPEAAKDPQLAFREILETWPPTDSDISSKQLVKAAYLTDQDGPKITSSAPTLGEHNERILDALGYSESAIAELRADGVIS